MSHRNKGFVVLTWVWLISVTLMTVARVAPDGVNADILMNSVMSQQNITLYYWGQNRLLNVLPLAATWLSKPSWNLFGVLVLATLSFYGLLYVLSRCACLLVGASDQPALRLSLFVLISVVAPLVFTTSAMSHMTIGHIEYSFPALLLALVSSWVLVGVPSRDVWSGGALSLWAVLAAFALVLAVGMNPSTVIAAVSIAGASLVYKRRLAWPEVLMLIVSIGAFVGWDYISALYGSSAYSAFRLDTLQNGIQKVLFGLLSTVHLLALVCVLVLILGGKLIGATLQAEPTLRRPRLLLYVALVLALFCLGWLLLFTSNQWVEGNAFAWRYFIFVLFAGILMLAIYLAEYLQHLGARLQIVLACVVAAVGLYMFFPASDRFDVRHYGVFQRADTLTSSGWGLYAGDYWTVWPSVLRDMLDGHVAYGLAQRAHGNAVATRAFMIQRIQQNGQVTVICLKERVPVCLDQINHAAGPMRLIDVKTVTPEVIELDFVDGTTPSGQAGAN